MQDIAVKKKDVLYFLNNLYFTLIAFYQYILQWSYELYLLYNIHTKNLKKQHNTYNVMLNSTKLKICNAFFNYID